MELIAIAQKQSFAIGSPCYLTVKELVRILTPLVGQTDTNVKSSAHFVQLVQNTEIHNEDLLVTFDVDSLFTKVPIDETLKIITKKVEEDETSEKRTILSTRSICQLVKLCLKSVFPSEQQKLEAEAWCCYGFTIIPNSSEHFHGIL